ncbi:uncharacterized protein SCHCODRAFT_02487098 [Schizophyllum commune H4-8]|uniref:Carbohydrate esterase family 16 protein n=1 Tax=Schizophyllum commune (strain H4-8 / FGSC 9210) TaxID=578458 RepID=D8PLA7_SCHCM|nr:uncharacterized protein SCHCODRAFT_02487098 [Schizophyllum commune H4-8]KAI5897473.1 hypothetical protein SCHCODRAFT_02487098 [Schizophyllum commune H4-8]
MAHEPRIVIFLLGCRAPSGDSYSVSAECEVDEDERPDGKTWVDHVPEYLDISVQQIQNFSTPGASTEEDLDEQLARFSNLNQSGGRLALSSATYGSPLSAFNLLTHVLFFGINDCGQNTADRLGPIVDKVIDAAQSLYTKFGARNFVFVDVPPTDRAPAAVRMECGDTVQGRVNAWNDHLRAKVTEWTSETQAKTTLFSSHEVITGILDEPEKYEFSKEDVAKEGGEIWVDDLHKGGRICTGVPGGITYA